MDISFGISSAFDRMLIYRIVSYATVKVGLLILTASVNKCAIYLVLSASSVMSVKGHSTLTDIKTTRGRTDHFCTKNSTTNQKYVTP